MSFVIKNQVGFKRDRVIWSCIAPLWAQGCHTGLTHDSHHNAMILTGQVKSLKERERHMHNISSFILFPVSNFPPSIYKTDNGPVFPNNNWQLSCKINII